MKRIDWSSFALLGLAVAGALTFAGLAAGNKNARGNDATGRQVSATTIGGEPAVTLVRPLAAGLNKPQFVEATMLPGNGMNLIQLKAFLPGKGTINVIGSPGLDEAKKYLETDNDSFGNNSFKIGGAILLPYPNRITGTPSADGKTIQTTLDGQPVSLPANWRGKNPGALPHAMHGLMLSSKFQDVRHENGAIESSVSAFLHAGNFGGHWPSQTDVSVHMALKNDSLDIIVTAKNVGKEPLPMAIGAHPYFEFPSGDRTQARIRIPAETRALVNNYDDVFPTGQLVLVKGTPYDFNAASGVPLGSLFMDESFTNLQRDAEGKAVVEVTDPAAKYGLRIEAISPEIKAIQVYAPPEKNFVAVEPQFNLGDPYNKKVWGKTETGIVTLQPGQSVSWHIRLELFTPAE